MAAVAKTASNLVSPLQPVTDAVSGIIGTSTPANMLTMGLVGAASGGAATLVIRAVMGPKQVKGSSLDFGLQALEDAVGVGAQIGLSAGVGIAAGAAAVATGMAPASGYAALGGLGAAIVPYVVTL